jgi:hypothetical protein
MKVFNLVIAVVYTLVYFALFAAGAVDGDSDMVVGAIFLSLPVVANWLSFYYWK